MSDKQPTFLQESSSELLPMLKIFESQPGLVLVLSPDLKVKAATDAYLEELQLEREKMVGQNIFDLFPQNPDTPEARSFQLLMASLNQVLSTGQQHQMEAIHYDVPSKDEPGKYLERYWNTTNSPVLNEQKEVVYIIHETRNITEKVKAERQLRESRNREQVALARAEHQRARLERYFMQIPAQICIFGGPEFVFEFVNPAYQEKLFPGRKLLGKPLAEAVPELMNQPIAEVLHKVYATGETVEGKEVYIPLSPYDGAPLEDHYFNYIQQARFDEEGKVDGIMSFAYDVTELVEARKEVQAINASLEERISLRTKELQQARMEAEKQKDLLHTLIMQAPVAISLLKGPSLIYELVNPAYQALFPGRKLIGNPLEEAIPEVYNSPVREQIQHVFQTGEAYEAKEALVPVARKEGGPIEKLYFDYILYPHYKTDHEVEGVLIFAYEVTKQVMARREIEENEEILQFALKAGKMATFDLDLITNQTTRSANHDQLFGYETNIPEWNMEALLEHMLPQDHEEVLSQFEKSLQTGELRLSPRIRQRDGNLRYIEGYGRVFYDADKKDPAKRKPVRIAGVVADVTERKLDQQQMERLAAIVENSSDFVGFSTPEGVGIYLNEAGRNMVGIEKEEYSADVKVPDFFTTEGEKQLREEIWPAVFEKGSWQGESCFRHFKTGKLIPVFYKAFSVKDPASGELLGLATITSDITEIKKKEEQLQALSRELASANEELKAANKAIRESNKDLEGANQQLTHINVDLDNFIYAASHDLKAPITNIEGLVQLLYKKLPKEIFELDHNQQIFRMMQDSISRFQKTIANLTDITRLQKDNSKEKVQVKIGEVVQEVLLDLEPMIQKADARLEVEESSCPPVSFAEKNMRSIVYNLVSNAIKYCSPDRKPIVRINCREEQEYIVMSVQDNGMGLTASNEKKLFSMFKRFHSHVEGSGIGLYMVKKIIENAGGKIEVDSTINKGSTFKVYFRKEGE